MKHSVVQIFSDTTPEQFCEMFVSNEPFVREFHDAIDLQLTRFQIEHRDDNIVRFLEYVPQRTIPGFMERLLRGARNVKERAIWDKANNRITVEIALPMIGRRVDFDGVYDFEAVGDTGCKRSWTADVRVRIPVVGKRIERYIARQMDETFETFETFYAQWQASQPARQPEQPGAPDGT